MGISIIKRGPSYRLRLRYKGYIDFSLTFKTYKQAEEWGLRNEEEYLKNPEKYHKWAKKNRKSVREKNIFHKMTEIRK